MVITYTGRRACHIVCRHRQSGVDAGIWRAYKRGPLWSEGLGIVD
jgi:hypothetical protein